MTQPTLRTERITLVPLHDDHLEFEVELDSDPEVMRYLEGRARTRPEVEAAHHRRLASASGGLGFWIGLAEGQFVGWWLLEAPERPDQGPVEGQAELGYRLLRRYWRQGLASEGSRELLRYAFADLHLDRVFAETMTVNAGSRATMATLGMHYLRTFHHGTNQGPVGSELGEVEYAITAAEWFSRNQRRDTR